MEKNSCPMKNTIASGGDGGSGWALKKRCEASLLPPSGHRIEAALSQDLNSQKSGYLGYEPSRERVQLRRFSHSFCGLVARFRGFPGFRNTVEIFGLVQLRLPRVPADVDQDDV